MRRVVTPLWLVLLASLFVWPQVGQRGLGRDLTRPSLRPGTPDLALPAQRSTATSQLVTGLPGPQSSAFRLDGTPGPALPGTVAPPLVPGAARAIAHVERPALPAATQRHFPRFPTGPPAVRLAL
ncbi:MAG TPA: hypothetical protein VFS40_00620 [Gemmatimonadales bacterium]|nr:hypothetical protein [Gemmatimonadales bacterium]